MSIFKSFKKREKEEAKELENRANQFVQEYGIIRRKYRCDFRAFIKFINEGSSGIQPAIKIIDVTKLIEEEDELERKRKEAVEEKLK